MRCGGGEGCLIDLNIPTVGDDVGDQLGGSGLGYVQSLDNAGGRESTKRYRQSMSVEAGESKVRKKQRTLTEIDGMVYQDNSLSEGGKMKAAGTVMQKVGEHSRRRPNVNCRVETFGNLCRGFDGQRRKWVVDMGFGGLLNLVGWHLPRSLCYWLMTRIDPVNEMLNVGNRRYRLSATQVRWVLGIPKGDTRVPSVCNSEAMRTKLSKLHEKYGQMWRYDESRSGKQVTRTGFAITHEVCDRLLGPWDDSDEEEFKSLFLMAALDMVLCPTQCSRMSADLQPAVLCASDARRFNWCGLVLQKLMDSVRRFGRTFYNNGYAGGCGGCTIFVAVYYLDRLARNPISWGARPRIKVWTAVEVRKACRDDKQPDMGDFGKLGVLDIAYGEPHPHEARDIDFPSDSENGEEEILT